ncbi:MAG TPA: tRNA (adenosine(37)-N6)-threonylcarbamoyltransferase complex dimerization subunit type 1 TsaB [Nocardioidaceae bacterium]|nr:tRNA (adenosine(37)-N6)-threonylcarbamoyltransferase complex dimerization subunit type 1 TsaB [Nocardioidaceae bacterium]
MLLALDTSTAYISVAVYDADTDRVLAARDQVGPMQHGELLAPSITECLAEAGMVRQDLTAIVAGVGPGPYTGLRVGIVTARTMGFALDIPVYGVCSLDAMAVASGLGGSFVVTSDARRKELFWARYESGARMEGPFVDRPGDVPSDGPVVGLGPSLYPDHFDESAAPSYPLAAHLARAVAAERVEIVDAEPIYLRRPDAVTPGPPKKVS